MNLQSIVNTIKLEVESDLYEIYKDQFQLNEGLIVSWPIEKTISILRRDKLNVSGIDNNAFLINFKDKSKINNVLVKTNNLGWFPAYIRVFGKDFEDKGKWGEVEYDGAEIELIVIHFEAKYDILISDVPKYLYHITPKSNALKILNFGLSPKSKSILSSHPDRIFLTKTTLDSEKLLSHPKFANKSNDGLFWILKINTNLIPQYFKIYSDPNFKPNGIYTLNSIPPKAITFEKECKYQ